MSRGYEGVAGTEACSEYPELLEALLFEPIE